MGWEWNSADAFSNTSGATSACGTAIDFSRTDTFSPSTELHAVGRKVKETSWRCNYCGLRNSLDNHYCGEGLPFGCGANRP